MSCEPSGLSQSGWQQAIMWTTATRTQHSHAMVRLANELIDAEYAVPPPSPIGQRVSSQPREIVNVHVLRSGNPWRMSPPCFASAQTTYGFSARRSNAWGYPPVTTSSGEISTDEAVGPARQTL